jgi:hypothetical protein
MVSLIEAKALRFSPMIFGLMKHTTLSENEKVRRWKRFPIESYTNRYTHMC